MVAIECFPRAALSGGVFGVLVVSSCGRWDIVRSVQAATGNDVDLGLGVRGRETVMKGAALFRFMPGVGSDPC